jgi:hypothetical protein
MDTMSESTNTTNDGTTPPAGTDNSQQQNQGTPPAQPTIEELIADRDKWKAMSRTNEDRWKEASKERDDLKQASMTDSEKALEQAKQEARNSALAEVGTRLVESELRTAAVTAGVQLPSFEFLNTSQFVDSNGLPDADRIKAFVESLPKPATGPEYSQDLGLGRQGSALAGQLSRADLANMTPQEIAKARSEGRLDALMRGEI